MEELTYPVDHDAAPTLTLTSQSFKSATGSVSSIVRDKSLRDPLTDPDSPRTILFKDVISAENAIADGIVCTPCESTRMSEMLEMEVYFKMDFLQYTGSVKERGARTALAMLEKEKRQNGVITASLGNHALALSYHGNEMGIPVTVVMPVVAPLMKITRCRSYKAHVVVRGKDMNEAKLIALKLAMTSGYTYIDNHDNPHVMAGQGTMGLEIMNQVADVDAVVLPVGSGGLLAGTAVAIKTRNPKVKIIGVESERCPSFTAALEAGKPSLVPIQSTLADSLAVPLVGANSFATARPLLDKMVVVSEDWIAQAMLQLIEVEKCIVEGAGAATLAAALSGQLNEFKGKKVVLAISGGNVDTAVIGRCIERGLTAEGRLVKFTVAVSDRPGSISELTRLIGSIGASIKDISQGRTWIMDDIFSIQLSCVCETRDKEHAIELRELMKKTYRKVSFMEVTAEEFPAPSTEADNDEDDDDDDDAESRVTGAEIESMVN